MVESTQLTTYAASIYSQAPTLLPENIASVITAIALATRLSLRCSSILIEALLESVKYSTSFSIGISRQAIINALSTAKKLHDLTLPIKAITDTPSSTEDIDSEKSGFLQVLDKYTNLGIYIVHHSLTLVELFTLSGLQFTSNSIKYGLMAAEESVAIIDGIFGSNESSRAIASIITLVHRELINDPEFALTKVGKVAILSGLTKAMTAFAVLQSVTHKRTMKHMKITLLWKGLVVEEEEKSRALIQYEQKDNGEGSSNTNQEQHPDIIHELEEILANTSEDNEEPSTNGNANNSLISLSSMSSNLNGKQIDLSLDHNGNPYSMYQIVTTTNRITTRTTRITPIDVDGTMINKSKQVIERTDEEENEAFVAMIDQHNSSAGPDSQQLAPFQYNQTTNSAWHGSKPGKFKIMLSSVSKKLSRKKVERQTKYGTITNNSMEETIDGPITTMTSTSTTLQEQQSSIFSEDEDEEEANCYSEPETKSKRRMSWSDLKMKTLGKKKSVSNLFQKGAESVKKKKKTSSPPPPVPYLQPSNSITSLSRTLKTTTYTSNTPTPSTSRSLSKSPSVPSRLNAKKPSSPLDLEPSPQNFPRRHIITNIAYFIRYASAAYGESFMRILGIGDIPSVLPNSHHPNHHAFAHHTGVSVEDILLSSYTDSHILSSVGNSKLHALVHYVTVDHRAEAIVLTCRGTLGLSDVLTDLTCDYKEFTLPGDAISGDQDPRRYVAHGGMLEAAQLLATQKGKVFETIKQGLADYPNYGLVICGHSLGAGVASLLSVLWSEERLHFLSRRMKANHEDGYPHKFLDSFAAASIKKVACPFVTSEFSGLPAGRPIHCYTYGSPCVMSLPLSEYCGQGLVTSVVHAFDIVSGLSLGLLKDFKNVAVSLHEDSHVTDEILSRVVGHYQQKKDKTPQDTDEEADQWFWALIKTMRADMKAEKLYPPSTVYLIESVPQLVHHVESASQSYRSTNHKRAHMVKFSKCEDVQARFSEIVFSRTMFMDHSPNMYEKAINQLNKGYFG